MGASWILNGFFYFFAGGGGWGVVGVAAAVCTEQGPAGDASMQCSECLFFYIYPLLLLSFFSPLFCFSFFLFLVFSYVFVFSWSVVLLAHLKRELDNMGLISFPISDLPKKDIGNEIQKVDKEHTMSMFWRNPCHLMNWCNWSICLKMWHALWLKWKWTPQGSVQG